MNWRKEYASEKSKTRKGITKSVEANGATRG